jgi:hypothetical protein
VLRAVDPAQPNLEVSFNGIIESSIQMVIVGTGNTSITATAIAAQPIHSAGTIDFGAFTTTQPQFVANADGYRITGATPGAIVAAKLMATVTYNGATTASMTVERLVLAGGGGDVPLANLRIASPALATWPDFTGGVEVPDAGQPGYDLCQAQDVTCTSATPYEHQLAVWLPDSQLSGPFSTVVLYSATTP